MCVLIIYRPQTVHHMSGMHSSYCCQSFSTIACRHLTVHRHKGAHMTTHRQKMTFNLCIKIKFIMNIIKIWNSTALLLFILEVCIN